MATKVRMPSDNLTPGQMKQLNSEVELYSLGRPMKWQQLEAMPADLRRMYLEKLQDEYKATQIMLAGMLGVSVSTMRRSCRQWGINFPKNGGHLSEKDRQRWEEFLGKEYKPVKMHTAPVEAQGQAHTERPHMVPRSGSMQFHGPACDCLRTMQEALRYTPCSLTISWEVEE